MLSKFTHEISDRTASLRIPMETFEHGYRGHLEDRRPAANACPYLVTSVIMKRLKNACKDIKDKNYPPHPHHHEFLNELIKLLTRSPWKTKSKLEYIWLDGQEPT